jgi:nanoRNase/pAp phosphatase (c-di-AMP/oligoRNAs hydrolase)
MLAWDYLHNGGDHSPEEGWYQSPPLLLNHIQDRDLWKFKLAGTREISAAVFSFEYTFENWDKLMSARGTELLQLTAQGAAIERKHHKDIAELVKVTERLMLIGGEVVPCASLPYTMSSDACHLMAERYKEGTKFAACYWDTSTHRIFSLRSCENGIDVSEIAKMYGGGGHKHASGFKVPRDHDLAGV